jgi:hypothetical protein
MRPERFEARGLWVERHRSRWNGESFRAWKPNISMWFSDRRALLSFVGWPKGTPTGDSFRSWLASMGMDASETDTDTSLSDEQLASGFGPECHLDETDPNHQTRTVI